MATLAEKLSQAIEQQQAEIDRLRAVVDTDLPAAESRLKQLRALKDKMTPEIEAGYQAFRAYGIRLDE